MKVELQDDPYQSVRRILINGVATLEMGRHVGMDNEEVWYCYNLVTKSDRPMSVWDRLEKIAYDQDQVKLATIPLPHAGGVVKDQAGTIVGLDPGESVLTRYAAERMKDLTDRLLQAVQSSATDVVTSTQSKPLTVRVKIDPAEPKEEKVAAATELLASLDELMGKFPPAKTDLFGDFLKPRKFEYIPYPEPERDERHWMFNEALALVKPTAFWALHDIV